MELLNDLLRGATGTLRSRNLKIAFAESASAGYLAHAFSMVPQAGDVLLGGIVCYDACIKESLLGVPKALLDAYTAESPEVTCEMARRCAGIFSADVAIAVTGLTSPGGSETHEKPVGTMFIHLYADGLHRARRHIFSGSPQEIVMRTVEAAAAMIVNAFGTPASEAMENTKTTP